MNHLIAYPLTWDDIELRANNTIGIYKIKNKIAVLSCVSYTAQVDDSKDYMHGFILTNFSTDFTNHGQIRLMDLDDISALDCELYEKDGRFIINTKKYALRPSQISCSIRFRISTGREPLLTPMRSAVPVSCAFLITALTRSSVPIFPGLMRIFAA